MLVLLDEVAYLSGNTALLPEGMVDFKTII